MNARDPGQVQGPGCKHDGGALWVSIPLEDDPVVAAAGGGATYAHTIWARFYQKNDGRFDSKSNHYYNDDLVECLAIALCTTTGG